MNVGFGFAIGATVLAGLSALIGLWLERDPSRPRHYAYALTSLVVLSIVIDLGLAWADEADEAQLEEDVARILASVEALASEQNNSELSALLGQELSTMQRARPEVVERLRGRLDGDPDTVLRRYLPNADVRALKR